MIEVRGTDFELGDVRLSLKLEQLQHAGSFETRGAFAGAGAHQRLGDAEPLAHVPLVVVQAAGGPERAEPTRLGQARASRRSVLTVRRRCAYIGAKFGSATSTAWPRRSRQRATHPLSVAASMRIRAGGRSLRSSAKRCGSCADVVLYQFLVLGEDANLAVHPVDVDANLLHG